jgi:hypothetical protein
MYLRLLGLNPSIPGNSFWRSWASRSMTRVPQPSVSLPDEDIPADGPIEKDKLPVNGEGGAHLGGADAALELLEEVLVAGGEL